MPNPTNAPVSEATPAGTMLLNKAMEVEQHSRMCRKLADILGRNLTGMCRKEDAGDPGDQTKMPSDLTSQVKHHLDEASDETQILESTLRGLLREFNISGEDLPGAEEKH